MAVAKKKAPAKKAPAKKKAPNGGPYGWVPPDPPPETAKKKVKKSAK